MSAPSFRPQVALVLMTFVWSAVLLTRPALGQTTDPSQLVRPVVSEFISENVANQRRFTGVIEARKEIDLAFQTAGILLERQVDVGDIVKKGDLIASLDRVILADAVSIAEAALAGAQIQQATVGASLKRAVALADRGVTAKATVDVLQSALSTADAGLQQAEAALVQARDSSSFTKLIAPADGTIITVAQNAGAVVTAGKKIASMAAIDGRDAVIDVPEQFLEFLTVGDAFSISLRFGDVPPVTGQLRLVEPVADVSTRSRRIKIELKNAPTAYRLGSLVRANRVVEGSKVLSLPASSIIIENGATSVWRITPEVRTVERINLSVRGTVTGNRVIVEGGLALGDEIVVKGVHSLKAGQAVGARETQ